MVGRKNQKGNEMKNVLLVAVLMFLLVAGCSNQYTTSVHGGGGIGVRFGNIIDANRVEIGGGAFWLDGEKDPQSLELYAIRYGPNIIEVVNPFAAGPEKLNGRPYFGVSLERDLFSDTTSFSPITGISLEQFLYAEYNINKEDAILGIKYTWEF
jgi:hypothetical protein